MRKVGRWESAFTLSSVGIRRAVIKQMNVREREGGRERRKKGERREKRERIDRDGGEREREIHH